MNREHTIKEIMRYDRRVGELKEIHNFVDEDVSRKILDACSDEQLQELYNNVVAEVATLARTKRIRAALPEAIDLEEWSEDEVTDTLVDADVDLEIRDEGIGHYEYWGATGFDSRPCAGIRDESFVLVRFPDSKPEEGDPEEYVPETFKETRSSGGCDGEHMGRCKSFCAEMECDVEWELYFFGEIDGRYVAAYTASE